ncbi:MAG TPA: TonB-dependent receptor [Gemmatimonadaceae bacterium]|nr:TonB-dependent receptor [Gemmatimonadaceae bacterium]
MHSLLRAVLPALALSASFTVSLHAQAPAVGTVSDPSVTDSIALGAVAVPRRALGADVTIVSGAALVTAAGSTLERVLAARVSGMRADGAGGIPGGGALGLLLRGPGSLLGGSDPLVLVDGVIVDHGAALFDDIDPFGRVRSRLADINPADVERVEVLRGPAATALYGARGANGVVHLHTKRGAPGRPTVTVTTRAVDRAVRAPLEVNRAPLDTSGAPVARFDHQDAVFRRGRALETALDVAGGNTRTRYFASGHWTADDGVMRGTDAARRGLRLNASRDLGSGLELDVGGSYTRSTIATFAPSGSDAVVQALIAMPTSTSLQPDEAGNFPEPHAYVPNPLRTVARGAAPVDIDGRGARAALRWSPLARLEMRYALGYDDMKRRGVERLDPYVDPFSGVSTVPEHRIERDSRLVSHDLLAAYTIAPRGAWTLGTSLAASRVTHVASVTDDFRISPSAYSWTWHRRELRTDAVTVQQRADGGGRLALLGGVRWERVSDFGDREWTAHPLASASYELVPRDGMASTRVVNHARLRAAWGRSSRRMAGDEYLFIPINPWTGAGSAEPLRPERTSEIEGGIDVGLWGDRVQGGLTLHRRRTGDLMVLTQSPPSTSGGGIAPTNAGALTTTDSELRVRASLVERAGIGAATTLGAAVLRSRVTGGDVPPFYTTVNTLVRAGEAPGVFAGNYVARDCVTGAPLTDAQGHLLSSTTLSTDPVASVAHGSCNRESGRVLGSPHPTWEGSLLQELRLGRRWQLHALVTTLGGHQVLNHTRRRQDGWGTSADAARELLPADDPARLPAGYVRARSFIVEPYVEDADAVRLREIALSYTLDHDAVRRLVPGGAQLTLAGHDVAVWTRYSGYDPEGTLPAHGALGRGIDQTVGPTPRSWSLAARLRF